MLLTLRTTSVDQTRAVAEALAPIVTDGDLLLLTGDLGTGKTAFVQGLARGLLVADRVTSPTFTIMQHHEGRLALHHVDAYRLESPAQVFELALSEVLDEGGVMVVEWGELVLTALEGDHLDVVLRRGAGDDDRHLEVRPVGGSWLRRNPQLGSVLAPWTVEA